MQRSDPQGALPSCPPMADDEGDRPAALIQAAILEWRELGRVDGIPDMLL